MSQQAQLSKQPQPNLQVFQPNIPYSYEAEQSLLGAILINPDQLPTVRLILKTGEMFFFSRHADIWRSMCLLADDPLAEIDHVSLGEKLKSQKKLDEVGGYPYLTQLVSVTPTSVHAEVYAGIIVRSYARRQLLQKADEVKRLALDESISVEQVGEGIDGLDIPGVMTAINPNKAKHISKIVHAVVDDVDEAMNNPQAAAPIPSIKAVNEFMGGWWKDRLYVIAGRTHMGKSAFIWSQALIAAKAGKRVFLHSCETDENEIIRRMAAMEAKISPALIQQGNLTQDQYRKLLDAMSRINSLPIYIDYRAISTPNELATHAQHIYNTHGFDIMFIDHMHQMTLNQKGLRLLRSQHEQLAYMIRAFSTMAKDKFRVPVIVAAQLNRGAAGKNPGPPRIEHLKGSGAIEEVADCTILIHRPGYYDNLNNDPKKVHLIVSKNRINGQMGTLAAEMNPVTAEVVDDANYLERTAKRRLHLH